VINWVKATVIDREPDRPTRWIKKSVHICKEGQQAMSRDKGSYQPSHTYDRFLDMTAGYRVKIQQNQVPAFLQWRPPKEVEASKVSSSISGCVIRIYLAILNSDQMLNFITASLSTANMQVMKASKSSNLNDKIYVVCNLLNAMETGDEWHRNPAIDIHLASQKEITL